MPDNEVELTELTDIEVTRQDAVAHPASGFPVLLMKAKAAKAVNAVGGIDEKPDIDVATQIIQCLGKLIMQEAQEITVGADEECDIHTLAEALSLMQWFRTNEQWEDCDDGSEMGLAKCILEDGQELVFKAHRKFASSERKRLAQEGKALPDGSYPIPDADALRRAAILARSGHGDVAAAKRLIARRAKELGVPNPLTEHDDSAKKAAEVQATPDAIDTQTPETTPQADEQADGDGFSKEAVELVVTEAVAKAIKPHVERTEALEAELAKMRNTPIPGGPMLTAPQAAKNTTRATELVEKAAYHKRLANMVADPELVQYHTAKAREADEAAAALR